MEIILYGRIYGGACIKIMNNCLENVCRKVTPGFLRVCEITKRIILLQFSPDLVLVSAGFDSAMGDEKVGRV